MFDAAYLKIMGKEYGAVRLCKVDATEMGCRGTCEEDEEDGEQDEQDEKMEMLKEKTAAEDLETEIEQIINIGEAEGTLDVGLESEEEEDLEEEAEEGEEVILLIEPAYADVHVFLDFPSDVTSLHTLQYKRECSKKNVKCQGTTCTQQPQILELCHSYSAAS